MTQREAVGKGYRAGLDSLRLQQKPGAGVPAYLRWVNRSLGRHAAALAHQWGVTPNAVTGMSMALSLGGLVTLTVAGATVAGAVTAMVLLLAGYALDSADGQLARLTGTGSKAGEWLDHLVDSARLPSTHLAIAIFLFVHAAPIGFVALSLAFLIVASVWFFGQILAEQLLPSTQPVGSNAPAWVSFAKLPYDTGAIYILVVLLPWLPIFLGAYVALFVFTVVVAAVSLWRKYRSLREQS